MADKVTQVALIDQPEECWGNSILYRLAVALGDYSVVSAGGSIESPVGAIVADPDEVLARAEAVLVAYREGH